MLDKKTVITIGLIVSSAVIGYVLWPRVKQEKKCIDNTDIDNKDESKED
jgi:hypothetical protein